MSTIYAEVIETPADECSLLLFEETKAALHIDPDSEPFPPDVDMLIARITGTTATTFTRRHADAVKELLDSPEAATEWVRQRRLLDASDQIALPAGPAKENDQ